MPDIHWGDGFCIGGVCATDPPEGGVVSPGGVGYDINCGVRLVRSSLTASDVQPRLEKLVAALFHDIPAGTGRFGKYHFYKPQFRELMQRGPAALVSQGLATTRDVEFTEAGVCLADADPAQVGDRRSSAGPTSAARS